MSDNSNKKLFNPSLFDAEGERRADTCPKCGSQDTVTYVYTEGDTDLECRRCGFSSEVTDISELTRYRGDLLEQNQVPPVPLKKLKA
jgi:uncharacterized metal-binding protein (TIGR02443 family)